MSLVERTVDIAIEALNILVDKAPGFHAWEKDVARPSLQNIRVSTSNLMDILYSKSPVYVFYDGGLLFLMTSYSLGEISK